MNNQTDNEMFEQIERDSWHNSLLEKTRSSCPGMNDAEIVSFLKDMLGVNVGAIVTYCMANADACYDLDYIQVAKLSGLHSSHALSFSATADASAREETVATTKQHPLDVEGLSDVVHARSNFEDAVRNDSNYMPYCYKLNIDPDDATSINGYAFSHGLVNRVVFFFIGGAFVLPLLYLYLKFVGSAFDLSAGVGLTQKVVLLRENMNFTGYNSDLWLIGILILAMLQVSLVVYKIQTRIIGAFIGHAVDMLANVGRILRS